MSEDRLWKFKRPEWMNSVFARNAGVYASGALVRFSPPLSWLCISRSLSSQADERPRSLSPIELPPRIHP